MRTIARALVTTLLALALAVSATAGHATDLFDVLRASLQSRLDTENAASEPDRKTVKSLEGLLRKIDKDTATPFEDVRLLRKVSGKVAKKFGDDSSISAALDAAVDDADSLVVLALSDVRLVIDAAEEGKQTDKAAKVADNAQKLIDKSRTRPKVSSRLKTLERAYKVTNAAGKKASKLTPRTGGGGDVATRIALIALDENRMRSLMRLDFPGAQLTKIVTGEGHVSAEKPTPVCSPDGCLVAFVQDSHVVIAAPFCDDIPPVSMQDADSCTAIEFSPDSKMVAFGTKNPNRFVVAATSGEELFSADIDIYGGDNAILWTCSSRYCIVRANVDEDLAAEVLSLDTETLEFRDISATERFADSISQIAVSPCDDRVCYAADEDTDTEGIDIVCVNADGTDKVIVSRPQDDAVRFGTVPSIDWVPTGDGLVYQVGLDGGDVGLIYASAGGTLHNELASGGGITQFEVSPSSDAVGHITDGAFRIDLLDGSDEYQVAEQATVFYWIQRDNTSDSLDRPDALFLTGTNRFSTDNGLFAHSVDLRLSREIGPPQQSNTRVYPVVYFQATDNTSDAVGFASNVDRQQQADFFHAVVDTVSGSPVPATPAAPTIGFPEQLLLAAYPVGTDRIVAYIAAEDSPTLTWRFCCVLVNVSTSPPSVESEECVDIPGLFLVPLAHFLSGGGTSPFPGPGVFRAR